MPNQRVEIRAQQETLAAGEDDALERRYALRLIDQCMDPMNWDFCRCLRARTDTAVIACSRALPCR
jgi:hypothetical protein